MQSEKISLPENLAALLGDVRRRLVKTKAQNWLISANRSFSTNGIKGRDTQNAKLREV